MNSSWCPLPWKGINIRNNGDFRVCCNANVSGNKGILRAPNGRPLNARSSSLEEVRNSALLKDIRLSMLKGEPHESCRRCNIEDETAVVSRRSYEREFWQSEFTLETAQQDTSPDGSIRRGSVGYVDVRFGNLCNLKCRMCGPTDSSFWYKEHAQTVGAHFQETSGRVTLEARGERVAVQGDDPYSWHESEFFWQQLEENLNDIRKIYCVGGEPLLIERHYELLRKLVETGVAKQVILEYNSNITTVPERALILWKEFGEVRIGASLDGYGALNDYIRHPSRWSVIERNLNKLDACEGNVRVWITTTVQAYNILYLPELLRWKIERNFQRVGTSLKAPFIKAHPLHAPQHFHIQVLPNLAKRAVAEKLEAFYAGWFRANLARIEPRFGSRSHLERKMLELLEGYKTLMFKEDLSHLLPQFLAATERMDRARGENWRSVMPELAGLLAPSLAVEAAHV